MARRATSGSDLDVRLSFQLFTSDNPLLVADLLGVRKGRLRHARLVTLATLGLITEQRLISGETWLSTPGHGAPAAVHGAAEQIRPLTGEDLEILDGGERGARDEPAAHTPGSYRQ
jgi:hypothetical protein